MYVCMYMCMYVCIYICMYVCTYVSLYNYVCIMGNIVCMYNNYSKCIMYIEYADILN